MCHFSKNTIKSIILFVHFLKVQKLLIFQGFMALFGAGRTSILYSLYLLMVVIIFIFTQLVLYLILLFPLILLLAYNICLNKTKK